jgi:hypothetical protein
MKQVTLACALALIHCAVDEVAMPSIPESTLSAAAGTATPEGLPDQNTRLLTRTPIGPVGISAAGTVLVATGGARELKPIANSPVIQGALGIAPSDVGYLVWSEREVYLGTGSAVAKSELSTFFAQRSAVWIDVAAPSAEAKNPKGGTLWITASDGAYFVRDGAASKVELSGGALIIFAFAESADVGLLFSNSGMYSYNIVSATLEQLTGSLGKVLDADRSPDGSVYIATESGVVVSRGGKRRMLKLGAPARSLAASATGAMLLTGDQVVQLDETQDSLWSATGIGKAPPDASSVASDPDGNVWLSSSGATAYFGVGRVISFETIVKPIVVNKCMGCHAGAGGPPIALDAYETAKEKATRIAARVKQLDNPMPPATAGKPLSNEELRDLVRWTVSGTRP